jgi:glycosyltransferase involved in cell wall biosynthesis
MSEIIPFISVIVPTYNRKELLKKAIVSVIEQDKIIPFDWELIIVDDGSIDETYLYIKDLIETDPIHIRYIYQKNT